jgi:hypothetical protein
MEISPILLSFGLSSPFVNFPPHREGTATAIGKGVYFVNSDYFHPAPSGAEQKAKTQNPFMASMTLRF